MWKVGGTKIERTGACYIFLCVCTGIREKVIFWVKRSVPGNFQPKKISGLPPPESLRTQDSENIVCLGDRASVIEAQSQVIGQKPVVFRGVTPPFFWNEENIESQYRSPCSIRFQVVGRKLAE